jgi:hypothetical protein
MTTSNLRARIERLERQAGPAGGSGPLIIRISRFSAPDEVFTGIRANGEFFPREPGESIVETERRVIGIVHLRRDVSVFVLKSVAHGDFRYVEELPE